jgi:phosphatidylglycerol:prolipoprotein diacylglycerol transferase
MIPTLFHVGSVPVTTWPIFAFAGFWAGFFSWRHEARDLGLSARTVWRFYFGAATAGFAGSHWMFGWNTDAAWDLPKAMAIWSGLSFYGGLILATIYGVVVWTVLGWASRMPLGKLLDRMGPPTGWAVIMGRLGCTLYGCCFGSPSGQWPGIALSHERWDFERRPYPDGLRGIPLHPSPLYEAAGLLLILWALAWMRKREERVPGTFPLGARAAAFYLLYGPLRFLLEFIRMDTRGERWLGFYPSQWVPLVTVPVALGFVIFSVASRRAASSVPFRRSASRPS